MVNKTFNFAAPAAIIAGGAWSPIFGQQLGVQIPVEPQHGQIIHLDLPGVETANWPVVNAFHGHYIVCWPAQNGVGRIVVGAARNGRRWFCGPHHQIGIHEVLSEALRVGAQGWRVPNCMKFALGYARWPPTVCPFCVQHRKCPAFITTGHGPNGLQLGPFSGKIAAALALGQPAEVGIRAFDLPRFQ